MLHDYYSLYVVYAMFYENKFIVIVIVIVHDCVQPSNVAIIGNIIGSFRGYWKHFNDILVSQCR